MYVCGGNRWARTEQRSFCGAFLNPCLDQKRHSPISHVYGAMQCAHMCVCAFVGRGHPSPSQHTGPGVDVVEFKARLAEGFNLIKHSRSGKSRWVLLMKLRNIVCTGSSGVGTTAAAAFE